MPIPELITLIVLGFAAGVLGGLLGIGGSVVMIPVLTLVLHRNQHLSQAAAMIINVLIAAPSVLRHDRAGAVEWRLVRRMLPAGLVAIVVGVEVSNVLDGSTLMKFFGLFLLYVIYVNIRKLLGPPGPQDAAAIREGWWRAASVGGITGFAAGLLGIGGGIIAVPLLQRICHLPLRRCIATSAALMCVTAIIGALRKNMALTGIINGGEIPLDPMESLLIAACLAPTAILGGLLGAGLTHSLPLRLVRVVFVLLLIVACAKFLGM